MMIDWPNFTPYASLLGGMLIGLAAALLVLFNGRILGVSGIIGGLLQANSKERPWRLAFAFGVILAPLIYAASAQLPEIHIDTDWGWLLLAGLIVGYGTRLGYGCTSGHGVCGLSRFSLRSLAATITFMLFAFATVFIMRHL